MNKFWIILKSRFKKDNSEEQWVKDRREICATCPHNSLNNAERTFKQKLMKALSDFYTWLTRAENEDLGECGICGCTLSFKCSEESENCPENKWKSIYIPNTSKTKNGKRTQ